MFQILDKYNIEFEQAPTFNKRRVGAYSRGGGGANSKHYGNDINDISFKVYKQLNLDLKKNQGIFVLCKYDEQ